MKQSYNCYLQCFSGLKYNRKNLVPDGRGRSLLGAATEDTRPNLELLSLLVVSLKTVGSIDGIGFPSFVWSFITFWKGGSICIKMF